MSEREPLTALPAGIPVSWCATPVMPIRRRDVSVWNDTYETPHLDLRPHPDALDEEPRGSFPCGGHERRLAQMLDGQVGRTRGGQGSGCEIDVRKLPVKAQARAGARLQSGLRHELLGH